MGVPDRLHVAHRDRVILVAEMHLDRHARRIVGRAGGDPTAIAAHRACEAVEVAAADPGDVTAEAIADQPHLAGIRYRLRGGVDIGEDPLVAQAPAKLAPLAEGDLVIAELNALLGAVEQRRRDRRITLPGEHVDEMLDVAVDAEDFLNDDDAALRGAGGVCPVAVERVAVTGGKRHGLSHVSVLSRLESIAARKRAGDT